MILALIMGVTQLGMSKKKDSTPSNGADVRAGTKISAQLESAVDAKTAKPGDEVTAKVIQDVKLDGKVVIRKGDHLIGRISDVQASSKEHAGSQLGVAFDRLVSGKSTTQLNAVVHSVISSPVGQGPDNEPPMLGPGPNTGGMMNGGGRSNAGGGVLGGTTSAVGATTGVAGSAAGNLGATVGGASDPALGGLSRPGAATPVKMIHIDSGVQAASQAGLSSELSTQKGDLRLEPGTKLELRAAARSDASANQ